METMIVIASGTSYDGARAAHVSTPGVDLRPRAFRPFEGVVVRDRSLSGSGIANPLTDPTQDLASPRIT